VTLMCWSVDATSRLMCNTFCVCVALCIIPHSGSVLLYVYPRQRQPKDDLQRQRHPKDVPKMEALREDVKDAESKDKDAKDVSDVFLMQDVLSVPP
jgi:hypothetical protein